MKIEIFTGLCWDYKCIFFETCVQGVHCHIDSYKNSTDKKYVYYFVYNRYIDNWNYIVYYIKYLFYEYTYVQGDSVKSLILTQISITRKCNCKHF